MGKRDVKTKEDLELYYNKVRKIKFSDEDVEDDPTIIESLRSIYINIYKEYDSKCTKYTRGGHHCNKDRRRSLDDYIKLCKYYFPESTLSEIIMTFIELCKEFGMVLAYCPNIRKSNLWDKRYTYYRNQVQDNRWDRQGFNNCNLTLLDIV